MLTVHLLRVRRWLAAQDAKRIIMPRGSQFLPSGSSPSGGERSSNNSDMCGKGSLGGGFPSHGVHTGGGVGLGGPNANVQAGTTASASLPFPSQPLRVQNSQKHITTSADSYNSNSVVK